MSAESAARAAQLQQLDQSRESEKRALLKTTSDQMVQLNND